MNAGSLFPRQCSGFIVERMDGEVVLLHPGRGLLIRGNETAALVWQLCDGSHTIEAMVEILAGAYPDARAQIAAEVPLTVEQLRAQGALDGG